MASVRKWFKCVYCKAIVDRNVYTVESTGCEYHLNDERQLCGPLTGAVFREHLMPDEETRPGFSGFLLIVNGENCEEGDTWVVDDTLFSFPVILSQFNTAPHDITHIHIYSEGLLLEDVKFVGNWDYFDPVTSEFKMMKKKA